jgi:hypothetical protein
MKQQFLDYLKDVGMTKAVVDRCEQMLAIYEMLCPSTIDDIFISEYATDAGQRELESLWLFSGGLLMEAKSFLTLDDFDFAPVVGRLARLRIQKKDYDFKQAVDGSRLSCEFVATFPINGDLKASGRNCDYLANIVRKYLVSNLCC